jgi:hypothetical protein
VTRVIQNRCLPPAFSRDERVRTAVALFADACDPTGQSPDALLPDPQSVMASYEAGNVIAFPRSGLRLPESAWQFLSGMPIPVSDSNFIKKAKLRSLLAPVTAETWGVTHVLRAFFTEADDARQLQALIQNVNEQLRLLVAHLFPKYKVVGENITWRLTQTESEEMHYDSYGLDADPHHHVRVFVNLDTKPRLWGVGNPVDETIRLYRDRCRPHARPGQDANQFNGTLNKILPWEEIPRHFVAFAPGNLWLVNSQVVAHEIVFGRRMIAATFDVDPASMLDPSRLFAEVVRKTVTEVL